jgi:phenylalanyl-tRNA synthetase beta chain
MVGLASTQAAALIAEHASAEGIAFACSGRTRSKMRSILIDTTRVQKNLGMSIDTVKIKTILTRLGFIVRQKNKDKMLVLIPSSRTDVRQEVDLIEEVARISGYVNILSTLPKVLLKAAGYKPDLLAYTKGILAGLGLQEVITYSLVEEKSLSGLSSDAPWEILNPLSQEQAVLRTTLLPGLLGCVSRNLNQQEEYVTIFETAKRFVLAENNIPQEELMLGVALCGARRRLATDGLIQDKTSILHLKGIAEVLFSRLGISDYLLQKTHSGTVEVKVKGEGAGVIFEGPKDLLERWGIKNKEVFLLELALEKILAVAEMEKKFTSLPLYPFISRDISLVIKEDIPAADILTAVRRDASTLLSEVKIADFYQGRQIPQGHKGLTLSLVYRCEERTLTEEEVVPLHRSVCTMLEDKFAAKIR